MPFAKGTPKPANSGRKKGSICKLSADVRSRLEALGCDPIEGMALISLDEKAPVEIRARMNAELAQYCYPKRRAIEHSGPGGNAIEVDHNFSAVERLKSRIAGIAARSGAQSIPEQS